MNTITSPVDHYKTMQLQTPPPPPPQGGSDSALPSSWKGGDQLHISQEARELLDSKMQQFGARRPSELTAEQHEEIKAAMDELREEIQSKNPLHKNGLDKASHHDNASEQGREARQDGPPPGDGPPPAGARGKGGPPPGGGAAGGATDISDEIEELEEDIEALEEEIQELEADAAQDEEAKDQLKTKRAELLLLEAELAMLEQQQTAAMAG